VRRGVSLGLGVIAAFALLVLVSVPAASAAEFGSTCKASLRTVEPTALQFSRVGAPLVTSAPGVVTSWAVTNPYEGIVEKLKVFKAVGAEFETVAESQLEPVAKTGQSRFAVRIPVAAGVQFGAAVPGGVPICYNEFTVNDKYSTFLGEVPVGTKKPTNFTGEKSLVALAVTVEPDADGDGFGDETQDACPTSALTQAPCPVSAPPAGGGGGGGASGGGSPAALDLGLKAKLEGNVVAVQVTGSDKATVAVSDAFRGRPVAGPKSASVEPGQVGRAYLPLSKSLKEKLAKLPRKQHLNLVIEAKGQSAAGASAKTSIEFALSGRKKPHRHHRSH
jgi:hypothetical protein